MKQINCTFSQEEYELIKEKAEQISKSPTGYVKYAALLLAHANNTERKCDLESQDLVKQMHEALDNLKPDPDGEHPFIVSSLFDESIWTVLPSSKKGEMAFKLKKFVTLHSNQYKFLSKNKDRINQYVKLK